MTGKASAYNEFGAQLKNVEWSWSASTDQLVVVTLWKNFFDYDSSPPAYSDTPKGDTITKLGNRDRIDHLKRARDEHDGRFRAVIAIAKDPNSDPLEASEYYARKNIVMRLTSLDESTGAFRATVEGE